MVTAASHEPHPLRTLFLDFNSFFASVEQQDQPALRGRPIGVAPVLVDSSCCIAASYEAKAYGVKTGTGVREAKRLCPDITIVLARPQLYVKAQHAAHVAADTVIPLHRELSIDEFVCLLDRVQRTRAAAEDVAHKLKAAMRHHLGRHIRCSVGIAPSRLIAKMASELQKPDGLTIIEHHEIPAMLAKLELTDVPGIASAMEARLNTAGVRTIPEFTALTEQQARVAWGSILGIHFHRWLHGNPAGEDQKTVRSTIGHSHVLAPEFRVEPHTRKVAVRLLTRAASRMRLIGYCTRRVVVTIDLMDAPPWSREAHVPDCDDTLTLLEALHDLWSRRPPGKAFRLGINLVDLIPRTSATLPLYGGSQARRRISTAIDAINGRYGMVTIYPASMLGAEHSAPQRIPFGPTPDLKLFGR